MVKAEQLQSNNKRIAKNTIFLYFRMLLTMVISLYTSRLILAALGVEDYGIYNVVGGFVALFNALSGSLVGATQRFISYEIGKGNNVSNVFSTCEIIHIFLALAIFVIAETIGLWGVNSILNYPIERTVAVNCVYQFSVIAFLLNIISIPYNALIIAKEKMTAFAYISIAEVILKLLIVYAVMITPFDKLISYSVLVTFVAIVIRIIYSSYSKKHFKDCVFSWKVDKVLSKKILYYVLWNLFGSIAGTLKGQGVNVILNIFFGPSVNAAHGVSHQASTALSKFVINFQLALNPQIVKQYAQNATESMFKLVMRASRYSFLLLFIISMPFLMEPSFVLNLWLKKVPDYSSIFLQLVIVVSLIDSLSKSLVTSIQASGKVRNANLIIGGITLLTLPVCYVLFVLGRQPYWALIVAIVVSICCLIARLIILKINIHFPVIVFIKKVVLRIICVVVVSVGMIFILKVTVISHLCFKNWVMIFASFIVAFLCSSIWGIETHEKTQIIQIIRKKIHI